MGSLLMVKAGSCLDRTEMAPDEAIRVRVSITSTALNLQALHGGVLLTLNQAYSAWCAERHLERMRLGLISHDTHATQNDESLFSKESERNKVDSLCPGLEAFQAFIDNTHDLPHPALTKAVSHGMVRSSSVASVAMDLIESVMSHSSIEIRKAGLATQITMSDIVVIRRSRSSPPQLVKLDYNPSKKEVIAKLEQVDGKVTILRDKPIECPEYVCFYCDQKHRESKSEGARKFPMLFKEVVVDDGNSDRSTSIARLEKLKDSHPQIFRRSFAFAFSVKRDRRIFLSYNFAPQAAKT